MNKTLKILVTGGSGMVGNQINFGIKPKREELDILDIKSIHNAVKKYKPDVILHLAALTDMIKCEENPKLAYKINVTGTKNIAKICKERNIKFVYMSTCVVFSGKKNTPHTESNKCNPINVYGKTKLEGEKVVEKILKDYLIIRTGWLFGGGKNDQKFIRTMYLKMEEGNEIKAINDRYGSPTYIPDLLNEINKLIEKNKNGIYHVVNKGSISYFEVAKYIKSICKFKTKIINLKSKEIDNKKLKRSNNESLSSNKTKLRHWKSALKEYLYILKNG